MKAVRLGLVTLGILAAVGVWSARADFTDDLVAWYTFNSGEELNDRTTGNQSDLVNAGGVSVDGGIATFSGSATSYLTATETGAELRPSGDTFTLWARIRLANPWSGAAKGAIISRGPGTGGYHLRMDDGAPNKLRGGINVGSFRNAQSGGGAVPTNVWTGVAFVWDGSANTVEVFVDASSVGGPNTDGDGSYTGDEPAAAFTLGKRADTVGDLFSGEVDEVRVYDRALSPSELAQITAIAEPIPKDYTTDLVAWYTFNKGEELDDRTTGNQSDLSNAGGVTIAHHIATFDGTGNSYLTATEAGGELNPSGSAWTLWTRIRQAGTPASKRSIIDRVQGAAGYHLRMDDDAANQLRGAVVTASAFRKAQSAGEAVPTGVWTELALVWNGATVEIFIDEVSAGGPNAATGAYTVPGTAFTLGKRADIGADFFIGEIDEVRVYDRALTAAQLGWISPAYPPSGTVIIME